jgi:ATP-binding cassette subfamily B protein
MIEIIKRIFFHLTPRRKMQCYLLVVLMMLSAFAELFSIGAVLPFIGVITQPEETFHLEALQPILRILRINSINEMLPAFTVIFVIFACLSGIIRMSYVWLQSRLTHLIGSDFSTRCYKHTLYQPYSIHLERNSSEIISTIFVKINKMSHRILNSIFVLISAFFVVTTIFSGLLFVNTQVTLYIFFGFAFIYLCISLATKKAINSGSKIVSIEQDRSVKVLHEGLGGIRDVIIDGSHDLYVKIFQKSEVSLRHATGKLEFIALSPRYVVEMLGISIFAAVCYFVIIQEPESNIIPFIAALALAAVRLLPYIQGAFASITNIQGHFHLAHDILELLDQDLPSYISNRNLNLATNKSTPLAFNEAIKFQNLSFVYSTRLDSPALQDISLEIKKGSRVGIIGPTGGGKSTLMDIMMGLLSPTEGKMLIDQDEITDSNQHEWRGNIVHVPQTIYLADTTIVENIAFGVSSTNIDMKKVISSAKKACLHDLVESWEQGYQTNVGEMGVKLSGGQRQRIGIARALYKNASVLFLDEATNALDNKTETAIMKSLYSLKENLTIIIVAHRTSTLKGCDSIIELSNGKISAIGSFEDLIGL